MFAANWTTKGLSEGAVVNSESLDFADATKESDMIIGVKARSTPNFRTSRRNESFEYRTIGALILTKSLDLLFRSKSSTIVSEDIILGTAVVYGLHNILKHCDIVVRSFKLVVILI